MKAVHLLLLMLVSVNLFACKSDETQVIEPDIQEPDIQNVDSMKLKISVGTNVFTATLNNNATATAFKAKLPITVSMSELNGNEKYFDLSYSLPTNALNPGTIQTGDLMMYGANTLVLFYKTFSTSYNYTRLGHIDNPSGLAAILGSGNVTVTFDLSK